MTPLSVEELAELRRLAEAATPGPWEAGGVLECHDEGSSCWHQFSTQCEIYPPKAEPGEPQFGGPIAITSEGERSNAAYIAGTSPDVMKRLLDTIEALQGALSERRPVWLAQQRAKGASEERERLLAPKRVKAAVELLAVQGPHLCRFDGMHWWPVSGWDSVTDLRAALLAPQAPEVTK